MKANLTIGDWLRTSIPFGTTGIDKFKIRYLTQNCGLENGEIQTFRDYKDVFPIPLTDEILFLNGWNIDGSIKSKYYWHKDTDFCVCFWEEKQKIINDDYYGVTLFNIRYVHELQHALRLVGLNELADNFKVK